MFWLPGLVTPRTFTCLQKARRRFASFLEHAAAVIAIGVILPRGLEALYVASRERTRRGSSGVSDMHMFVFLHF